MQVLYYTNRRLPRQPLRRALPVSASPPPTPATFGGAPTKFLYYVNRRLNNQRLRQRFPFGPAAPPPIPSQFGGAPTKFLYYVNRRLDSQHPRARFPFAPATPPPPTPTPEPIPPGVPFIPVDNAYGDDVITRFVSAIPLAKVRVGQACALAISIGRRADRNEVFSVVLASPTGVRVGPYLAGVGTGDLSTALGTYRPRTYVTVYIPPLAENGPWQAAVVGQAWESAYGGFNIYP